MPRDPRALLPAEIRTPANRSPPEPMLSWAFLPLQSVSRPPSGRLPDPFPPALSTTHLGEIGHTALQGFVARAGRTTLRRAEQLS
jgi:hypothetical protein